MKLAWPVNASVCTFGENLTNIRNGIITWIFFSSIEGLSRKIERKYGETNQFAWKTPWQMYYFRILFQKNAWIMNLKNPDLDLIWRISSECGFFGFMIRFDFSYSKETQNTFLDSRIRIRIISPKKHTLRVK